MEHDPISVEFRDKLEECTLALPLKEAAIAYIGELEHGSDPTTAAAAEVLIDFFVYLDVLREYYVDSGW